MNPFQELARSHRPLPFATDLFLHEEADPEAARTDGASLARVLARAARRWHAPVALPLMDLRLDKADLLACLGIDEASADRFHFEEPLDADTHAAALACSPLVPGSVARDEAIAHLRATTPIMPVGMTIGPFSLATKLMADPIVAIALMGTGETVDCSPAVRLLFDCAMIAEAAVRRSIIRQIEHGAGGIVVCEPTASIAFFSPRQIRAGATAFEQLVLGPNQRLAELIRSAGRLLFFHDCGELTREMVAAFATRLQPDVLSLGSSRILWEDAPLVPAATVLYGNLPSKTFYSDAAMPVEEVRHRALELTRAMRACGHDHILGTECDVLHVGDALPQIQRKVNVIAEAAAVEL